MNLNKSEHKQRKNWKEICLKAIPVKCDDTNKAIMDVKLMILDWNWINGIFGVHE